MKPLRNYASAVVLALALSSLGGCASMGGQGGMGTYLEDSYITAKVKTAILTDSTLKVADISVETSGGVVQLNGSAGSEDAVNRAAEIARDIRGVKSVQNDVQVK